MHPVWHFLNGVPTMGAPVNLGPLAITTTVVTSTARFVGPAGSGAAPTYAVSGGDAGMFGSTGLLQFAVDATAKLFLFGGTLQINDNAGTLAFGTSPDCAISRAAADVLTTPDRFVSTGPLAGIGYATGAGGAIAQGSGSGKATTVVLNTVTGTITMDGAALNAGVIVSFTLTNSAIALTDQVQIQHVSGGTVGAYTVTAVGGAGSATVYVRNATAGNLSEAIVLKYMVFKSVVA